MKARCRSGRSLCKGSIEMKRLIIVASIPAGIIGLALEHQLRTLTAKPEIAAVFLTLNCVMLLGAERLRRRTQSRERAKREGGWAGQRLSRIARESFRQ